MHPSNADSFVWDDANLEKMHQHGIQEYEVEEVFLNGPRWGRNINRGSGDWKMVGLTGGGRQLTIVVAVYVESRTLRAITGWDCTPGEVTRYLSK